MASITIFSISGLAILILLLAKKFEERRRKTLFLLQAISKANTHVRELHHQVVHLYSEGKEKASFFCKKWIPIHSRNSLNKLVAFLEEKRWQYINNMRDSRLLKKSDGLSEFFKNMSNIEKGNGEINDVYEDGSQEIKKELE
ncbi:MAG: hypothetical protein Q8P21_00490 [bacterium]|nr:hypothetical protein [bacterium]